MKFTTEQITQLKEKFSTIERIDPDKYLERFRSILASMNSETLDQVVSDGIKFVSKLAINEKIRRGETL